MSQGESPYCPPGILLNARFGEVIGQFPGHQGMDLDVPRGDERASALVQGIRHRIYTWADPTSVPRWRKIRCGIIDKEGGP